MRMHRLALILLGFLLLALAPSVRAQFTFTSDGATVTITGTIWSFAGPVLVVPPTVSVSGADLPVTKIGDGAFGYNTNLYSISLPNGVTTISSGAFQSCSHLTNVDIPPSLTTIGESAFWNCYNLGKVDFPAGLTTIGDKAFQSSGLASLLIPSSVVNFGINAFESCNSLTNLVLSDGLAAIGDNAFAASSLGTVFIPASVAVIGDQAFSRSYTLTAINVAPGNPSYTSIDGVLFNHSLASLMLCPAAKSPTPGRYTVPPGTTTLANAAFYACNFTNIDLPDGLAAIGYAAFLGTPLTSLKLPASLRIIYSGVFASSTLTSLTIPEGVTNIGGGAFANCLQLTNVVLPESLTSLGGYAFYGSAITTITFPPGLPGIPDGCFLECAKLRAITNSNRIAVIGGDAFAQCGRLTAVYFAGNAPSAAAGEFFQGDSATVYYLPGTTGWASTYHGLNTVPWYLPTPQFVNVTPGFGNRAGQLGITVSWATNLSVAVDATPDLAHPAWQPLFTNALVNGSFRFFNAFGSAPGGRFYRMRIP